MSRNAETTRFHTIFSMIREIEPSVSSEASSYVGIDKT